MKSGADSAGASPVEHRRLNYVLIDHENVQPSDLALLDREDVRLWVFVGATQTKLSSELAIQMHAMRERADYVRISGNGSNALDFHIAFYIGQWARDDPRGFFHIISRDTGFDPLVAHLKAKKVFARRSATIAEMPLFKTGPAAVSQVATQISATAPSGVPLTALQRMERINASLKKMGTKRPARLVTLKNHVAAQFQKQIQPAEVNAIISALQTSGALKVDAGKVAYR